MHQLKSVETKTVKVTQIYYRAIFNRWNPGKGQYNNQIEFVFKSAKPAGEINREEVVKALGIQEFNSQCDCLDWYPIDPNHVPELK
jgi:hypothetical protein